MARPAVVTRVKAEHVARKLPRRAARPLVAVAPARVENFHPRRAPILQRPAPAFAILIQYEVHLSALDQRREREVREIRRDELSTGDAGIAVARCIGIVGEAGEDVLLEV